MASILIAAVILLLVRRGRSGVIDRSERAYGTCQELMIPVSASANGADFNIPRVDTDIEAVAYAINADTWTAPKGPQAVVQNITIAGTYNIHAQLCVPSQNGSSSSVQNEILQIATHGLHYDARYWDPEIQHETNSYVEASLKAGYSILTYDRLGVGKSDKPDAYLVVQPLLQLEILHQLTLMARNGSLYDIAKRDASRTKAFQDLAPPKKVVHVGHSFGSVLTSAYISTHGSFSDGAIITGYIPNKKLGIIGAVSFGLQYAATSSAEYSDRPSGYVVANKQGIQTVFFGGNPKTAFTKEMLDYGDAIKQPLTVGEYTGAYTLVLAGQGSTDFKGPIQYLLPEFDFYICDGDCKGTYDVEKLNQLFPNKTAFEVHIQPNTGHALPLHNNATAGYQASFDFLSKNGL